MIERARHHSSSDQSMPIFSGVLQRKCGCGNHTVSGGQCSECSKKKSGLQLKLAVGPVNDSYEQEADRIADHVLQGPARRPLSAPPAQIQCYTGHASDNTETAPDSVGRVLSGSGRPLDSALRQDMEQRFGHDFSRVRVHSGPAAAESARELNALAYTVDHNVVFGAGQFNPVAQAGRRLLAHELTHVVQQTGGSGVAGGAGRLSAKRIQRVPMGLDDNLRERQGLPLPYRQAKELTDCIRIMGEQNAAYCRREVLGEKPSPAAPTVAPTTTGTPLTTGSGKTARILRMEKARDCAFTVTYANVRQVDCATVFKEEGKTPPANLCGARLVYDITSVTATGSKCPKTLDGLTLSENVKGDNGCTGSGFTWKPGPGCVIGPGGKISGCTDKYTLCGDAKKSCTEFVDQEIEIGGVLAEEHEIEFNLKKSGTNCTGTVTRT
ncbi:MAG TPA: DUF4157 domain-containing protein [Pyrinomonadaceae bacterium]|nr:DUF4157 domain-containing protein [Pyrinomonadaceae bacterium]